MECFPPVCRDKSAGLTERDWTEPRAHSFSYLCHAWWSVGFTNLASRTSSPDPVQFEPPFLHVWVCNCACVCVSEHIHWHPLFQLCRCLILCRDEGVWAGPDLSCRKRCLTCFFFFFFKAHSEPCTADFCERSLCFLRVNQKNVWAQALLGKEQSIP